MKMLANKSPLLLSDVPLLGHSGPCPCWHSCYILVHFFYIFCFFLQLSATYGSVHRNSSGRRPLAKVMNMWITHLLLTAVEDQKHLEPPPPNKNCIFTDDEMDVNVCVMHVDVSKRAISFFRAFLQGHMQTYCPLCPPHQELHTLPAPHTTTTTTITAAICLFVCYRQLWYSLPYCALCSFGVLCGKKVLFEYLIIVSVRWCCPYLCLCFYSCEIVVRHKHLLSGMSYHNALC